MTYGPNSLDDMTEVANVDGYGVAHTWTDDEGAKSLHVFRSTMYDYAPDGTHDPGRATLADQEMIADDPFLSELAFFLAGRCYTELPHDDVIPSGLFDTEEGRAVTFVLLPVCPGETKADDVANGQAALPHTCAVEALTAAYAAE